MKRLLALVILAWFFAHPAHGQAVDDQYIRIYNLIQQADSLNNLGQLDQALAKYREAQTALQRFQNAYPLWNSQVVKFRLNYLASKIAAVAARLPPPATTQETAPIQAAPAQAPAPRQPPAPVAPPDWTNQLNSLNEQVHQLQTDKTVLEAKLKEAFSAQPAAIDPRELARADERIKALQKENDSLKASLDQQKGSPTADAKTLEETRQTLAHANRQLAFQTEKAETLAREKAALESKLDKMRPGTASEQARRDLAEANRLLAAQTDQAKRLARQKEDLESRIQALTIENQAAATLRAENQLLKKQLAEAQASPATGRSADATRRQLAQAQILIATLQSERDLLQHEKTALQKRLKLTPGEVAPLAPPAPPRADDTRRQLAQAQIRIATLQADKEILQHEKSALQKQLKQAPTAEETRRVKVLERERDDLRKQLEAVNKQLASRRGPDLSAHVQEVESQLAALQARVEVVEARRLPYTAEELAVLRPPAPKLAAAEPKPGRSITELPPGTTAFVLEARQHFSAKQFDKAEQDYLQVIRRDPKSVPSLANLATIQLELNKLDEADKHIRQALALEPNDLVSLSVLGQLRFRQQRFDEALDAFSRAAKLDPQDAQLQNFLGLALSEKGLRGPAEAAFRRAVQIDPGYGDAHKNLAFVYLTQQPPLIELARWHYQKALAGGYPRSSELEKLFETKKPPQ